MPYEKITVPITGNPTKCVTKWTSNEKGQIAIYIGSEFGASMWVDPLHITEDKKPVNAGMKELGDATTT